ncbi:hypothetical protein ACEPPN_004650 [Leptodophora sp. 'Broadleaf-Isolate-01']
MGEGRDERVEEFPEEQAKLIKNPPVPNDTNTMEQAWNGVLRILNDDNRGWKQQLIFDLESDEYQGRAHVKNFMEIQAGLGRIINLRQAGGPFITHPATLDCLAISNAQPPGLSTTFQYVANKIEELRRIVALSLGLLHEEVPAVDGVTTNMATSTYPRPVEFSEGRHDDDKVDISEINITPTENEIRCNRPEYLVSANLDLLHFLNDQAQRHIDTHFRLLRHDIFGVLAEALGGLLLVTEQDISLVENPRLNPRNIRAYTYPKAHIRNLSFDHSRGLQVQLSFPHPTAARKKSKPQRRRWWEDSKRLEEGVFLSLLFFEGAKSSLLFFNVTSKETNPDKVASLSSHDYLAAVTTKLASNNRDDSDARVRLNCQKSFGILIELPGIILATFVPALESIRDMYRLCRLPFRQQVVPDQLEHQVKNPAPLDISPPTYTQNQNFNFSLKSIIKDGARDYLIRPMDTSPHSDGIIDKVDVQTTLNQGQCEALVSALSHEFVQIQGPSGNRQVLLGCESDEGPAFICSNDWTGTNNRRKLASKG